MNIILLVARAGLALPFFWSMVSAAQPSDVPYVRDAMWKSGCAARPARDVQLTRLIIEDRLTCVAEAAKPGRCIVAIPAPPGSLEEERAKLGCGPLTEPPGATGTEAELVTLSEQLNYGRGLDDGAAYELTTNPGRYAPPTIEMLEGALPGSGRESVALDVVEYLLTEGAVATAPRKFGCGHEDAETVQLVRQMLADADSADDLGVAITGGDFEPPGSLATEHELLGYDPASSTPHTLQE